jgi:hypothetical protein
MKARRAAKSAPIPHCSSTFPKALENGKRKSSDRCGDRQYDPLPLGAISIGPEAGTANKAHTTMGLISFFGVWSAAILQAQVRCQPLLHGDQGIDLNTVTEFLFTNG